MAPRPAVRLRPPLVFASFALLCVRGIALWVVIPLGFLAWICGSPWFAPRHITLPRFLGWLDLNLIAMLQRTVFAPFFVEAMPFLGVATLPRVTHRIRLVDPW